MQLMQHKVCLSIGHGILGWRFEEPVNDYPQVAGLHLPVKHLQNHAAWAACGWFFLSVQMLAPYDGQWHSQPKSPGARVVEIN